MLGLPDPGENPILSEYSGGDECWVLSNVDDVGVVGPLLSYNSNVICVRSNKDMNISIC